ncbi:MAG: hypothetical protein R2941_21900 [Desulfobacterales bacterium]
MPKLSGSVIWKNEGRNLGGSAILKHELTETAELTKAGFDVHNPEDIEKIKALFRQAAETGDPKKHIPFHLKTLRDEIEYVQKKLAEKNVTASLDEVASALYRIRPEDRFYEEKVEKLTAEFKAIGINWPKEVKKTITDEI